MYIPYGNTYLNQSRSTSIHTNTFNILANWSEFVSRMHNSSLWLQMFFFFDSQATFPFPRKDQSFTESQSVSHVFGKQRKAPCVDKLCHIITPNAVCLREQTLWRGARKPQCWNLRPAHVLRHMKGFVLWRGVLSEITFSLWVLVQHSRWGPNGSTGRSGPICSLRSNCDVLRHTPDS